MGPGGPSPHAAGGRLSRAACTAAEALRVYRVPCTAMEAGVLVAAGITRMKRCWPWQVAPATPGPAPIPTPSNPNPLTQLTLSFPSPSARSGQAITMIGILQHRLAGAQASLEWCRCAHERREGGYSLLVRTGHVHVFAACFEFVLCLGVSVTRPLY
jgi:hypothetical protein